MTARAPEFNALADADVGLSAPYPATLQVTAQSLDLTRAVSGLHLPVVIDGTANKMIGQTFDCIRAKLESPPA